MDFGIPKCLKCRVFTQKWIHLLIKQINGETIRRFICSNSTSVVWLHFFQKNGLFSRKHNKKTVLDVVSLHKIQTTFSKLCPQHRSSNLKQVSRLLRLRSPFLTPLTTPFHWFINVFMASGVGGVGGVKCKKKSACRSWCCLSATAPSQVEHSLALRSPAAPAGSRHSSVSPEDWWLMIHFPLSFNLLNYLPAHNPAFHHHHHLHSVSFIHLRLPRPLTSNLSRFFCFIAAPFFLGVSLIAKARRFPSIPALISHLLQPFTHPSVTGCVAPSAVFVLPVSVGHLHDFLSPPPNSCGQQAVMSSVSLGRHFAKSAAWKLEAAAVNFGDLLCSL